MNWPWINAATNYRCARFVSAIEWAVENSARRSADLSASLQTKSLHWRLHRNNINCFHESQSFFIYYESQQNETQLLFFFFGKHSPLFIKRYHNWLYQNFVSKISAHNNITFNLSLDKFPKSEASYQSLACERVRSDFQDDSVVCFQRCGLRRAALQIDDMHLSTTGRSFATRAAFPDGKALVMRENVRWLKPGLDVALFKPRCTCKEKKKCGDWFRRNPAKLRKDFFLFGLFVRNKQSVHPKAQNQNLLLRTDRHGLDKFAAAKHVPLSGIMQHTLVLYLDLCTLMNSISCINSWASQNQNLFGSTSLPLHNCSTIPPRQNIHQTKKHLRQLLCWCK